MGKLFYEIGLTDQDSESFVQTKDSKPERLTYNLRRQEPSMEKATLTWELRDTPVVRAMVDAWEKTIRSPFLLMNKIEGKPTDLHPYYTDVSLFWEYVNLVPLKDNDPYILTVEDAEQLETNDHSQFGVMYMDYNHSLGDFDGDYQTTWRWAIENDSVKHLREGPPQMKVVPYFHANFSLRKQQSPNTQMSARARMFMDRKQSAIETFGYVSGDPRCKIGSYRIGNLITDAAEANKMLTDYRYPCRHSIVSEEVFEKRKKQS